MICRIADYNIQFQNLSAGMCDFLKDYEVEAQPQFSVLLENDDIDYARSVLNTADVFEIETFAFFSKLIRLLSDKALFLHASLIEVNNIGVAFAAPSGTGKTTHTLLWKKLLGDKVTIINGDKPIIRLNGVVPYGYGTPWNGKENYGVNAKTPLKHICFIERSDTNFCEKISAKQVLGEIFSQIFLPKQFDSAANTLSFLNTVLEKVTLWKIKCNMDIEAAQVAYNTVFKEK